MILDEIKQFLLRNKSDDIVLDDDILNEIKNYYYDYVEGEIEDVTLCDFLDYLGDCFNGKKYLDLAALCYDLALKNQSYGYAGGFFLVNLIAINDCLKLKLANIYINENYKKHNPLEAAKLLFSYHTDHLAFVHLTNDIEDEFNVLFKQLSTIEPQMENFDYCYFLGLMYLDGIGTEVDYSKAEPLLLRALELLDDQISYTFLNFLHERACRNYEIKHIDDNIKVGDMISYGRYNNRKIIWRVIGEKDNCFILLSNEVLESTYVSNHNEKDYETLPQERFIEYKIIIDLPNSENLLIKQEYSTSENIKEYSFLPKRSELEKYIPDDLTTTAFPQAYINGYDCYGLMYYEDTMNCAYLFLDDGGLIDENNVPIGCVDPSGEFNEASVRHQDIGIRPIIYLKK